MEKRHVRFPGDRARQQSFAAPRRTQKEHALGDPRADIEKLLRIPQKFDNLLELLLGFLDTGDVVESRFLPEAV